MKKVEYVLYFNILFLTFMYVDFINENEWLKDALYGITCIALLFAVIYYKKNNFDKIVLLLVELVILNRKRIGAYAQKFDFSLMDSSGKAAWILVAVLICILIGILVKFIRQRIFLYAASLMGNQDMVANQNETNADNEDGRISKGVWIIGIFFFVASCYLVYLYHFVYLGNKIDISVHEEAVSNVIRFFIEYTIIIVGVLIVIWLIIHAVEIFLINKKAAKEEKAEKEGKAEKVDLAQKVFLLSLYLMLLLGFLEEKKIINVDDLLNALTNNTSVISSVALLVLYVGIVMVVSLVIAILVELRNDIQKSFKELSKLILRKCYDTLINVVRFVFFVTVDLFGAIVGLLIGDLDIFQENNAGKMKAPGDEKDRKDDKQEPTSEIVTEPDMDDVTQTIE